jgi:hypothetical protein
MDILKSGISTFSAINPVGGFVMGKSGLVDDDEHFGSGGNSISSLISLVITIYAVYLALKCKDKIGHDMILNILGAICCSPCYIVYRLIKPC